MSLKALSDYTFYSRYARYLPEKKRRETWKEAVTRVFDMHRTKYAKQIASNSELKQIIDEAEKAVMQKKVIGSQRALQFGGDATLAKNERIYNCSSGHIDRPRAFQEALYLLLCGVGVGFSTQYCHINKLPMVAKRNNGKKSYLIEDSIEGWSDAVGVLMSSYFEKDQPFPEYFGYEIEFDFSQIRLKGALISWGGIAPGPDGLEKALNKIVKVIERRFDKDGKSRIQLRPIDCYDIIMHESDSVLSGGIRRSATINLFSPEDTEMAMAKTGDWFLTNPQRGRSNNSALLIRNKTTREEFSKLFESTKKFGEPGFVWADHENITFNPCITGDALIDVKDHDVIQDGKIIAEGQEYKMPLKMYVESYIGPDESPLVLSVNTETMERSWQRVTAAALTRKKASIIEIKTDSGQSLKCTPDHRVWTNNRGWVEAAKLNSNDDVEIR